MAPGRSQVVNLCMCSLTWLMRPKENFSILCSERFLLFVLLLYINLRGFDPLLLFFMNEIKIVAYSFSSSVIQYNSNEKLLKAWSGARFYKNQHSSLIMIWRKLDTVETNCIFFCYTLKLKICNRFRK